MLKKKQKLVEKLFSSTQTDSLRHTPLPTNSQPIPVPTTEKEEACNVEGATTMEKLKCTSHAGEVEVVAVGEMLEERLFTICRAPGGNLEHTNMGHTSNTAHAPHTEDTSHMSHSHRKRRKFKFKKGTVAPQEQT